MPTSITAADAVLRDWSSSSVDKYELLNGSCGISPDHFNTKLAHFALIKLQLHTSPNALAT